MQYADDTQILVTGKKNKLQQLVTTMGNTLSVVLDWFTSHFMKVNTAITQLFVFSTKAMLRHVSPVSIKFGPAVITESRTVKNLGVVMDRHLTFEPHVDQLVARSTGTLITLSHAKHVLPKETSVRIVSLHLCSPLSDIASHCIVLAVRRSSTECKS